MEKNLNNEFIVNRKELIAVIQHTIVTTLEDNRDIMRQPIEIKIVKLPANEAAAMIGITRQTLSYWEKKPGTKELILPYISFIGKKKFFDVEGIQRQLEQYGSAFGGGRDQPYKEMTTEAIERTQLRRYLDIKRKIINGREPKLSESDKKFYEEQSEKKGEMNFLDPLAWNKF